MFNYVGLFLRLNTTSGQSFVTPDNTLSRLVFFNGANFVPIASKMQIKYGPVGNLLQYTCALDEASTTYNLLACYTYVCLGVVLVFVRLFSKCRIGLLAVQ